MEWQPIETAKEDGRTILLCKSRLVKVEFEDYQMMHIDWMCAGYFRKHGDGKAQKDFEEGFYATWMLGLDKILKPTHWATLPKAPTNLRIKDTGVTK